MRFLRRGGFSSHGLTMPTIQSRRPIRGRERRRRRLRHDIMAADHSEIRSDPRVRLLPVMKRQDACHFAGLVTRREDTRKHVCRSESTPSLARVSRCYSPLTGFQRARCSGFAPDHLPTRTAMRRPRPQGRRRLLHTVLHTFSAERCRQSVWSVSNRARNRTCAVCLICAKR